MFKLIWILIRKREKEKREIIIIKERKKRERDSGIDRAAITTLELHQEIQREKHMKIDANQIQADNNYSE